MLDIKFVRSNPEVVKQNIKNKFQDSKLPLVDEVLELDQKNREIKGEVEALRAEKNKTSKQIGAMMAQGKKEEAEELKRKVTESADKMEALSAEEKEVEEKDQVRNFQPPISGEEIMALFNLKPGREIGILKEKVKEAILEGEIENDKDQARNFVIKEAEILGLVPR